MLVVISGLPGAGKSSLADALGEKLSAAVLPVDPIEAAIWRCGIPPSFETGVAAYEVAAVLAEHQLGLGLTVIVDSVSSLDAARNMWRAAASRTRSAMHVVEVICSDEDVHRTRLLGRKRGIEGFPEPSWDDVLRRRDEWEPWPEAHLVVDSMGALDHNVAEVLESLTSERSPEAGQRPAPEPRGRNDRVTSDQHLTVREMTLADVEVRINYFHDASDDHLRALGVDRALLPPREAWLELYRQDHARPIAERLNFALLWEADGLPVGFSSADRIIFGEEAFMHLHILRPQQRRTGLGVEFVRRSARVYFEMLQLERLFCEPNAFNVAPNRTLQRAGFRYLFTRESTPGPINFPQATTRWVLDRSSGVAVQD